MRPPAVAIDLDGVLGDTRPLWNDWLRSVENVLPLGEQSLPEDRARAADELDRLGAGNWRVLLERFAEDRAPVYLRRDPTTSAALRLFSAGGLAIGVFTDAPEPLARVALAHLGAARHDVTLETGTSARERLVERLGETTVVIASCAELAELARGLRGEPGPVEAPT